MRTFSCPFAAIESGYDGRVQPDGGCVISTARWGKRGRSTRIARQGQQTAARPVGSDIKSRKICVRTIIAITRDIGIDQAGIPGRDIFIHELETLAHRWREVDDQHVCPLDEPLKNFLRARGDFRSSASPRLLRLSRCQR